MALIRIKHWYQRGVEFLDIYFLCFHTHEGCCRQLRIQGGLGGHGPLSLLKLVIKKDGRGPLYFMFLAPHPPPP